MVFKSWVLVQQLNFNYPFLQNKPHKTSDQPNLFRNILHAYDSRNFNSRTDQWWAEGRNSLYLVLSCVTALQRSVLVLVYETFIRNLNRNRSANKIFWKCKNHKSWQRSWEADRVLGSSLNTSGCPTDLWFRYRRSVWTQIHVGF